MEKIKFENGKTSLSAETFNAMQDNFEKSLTNYTEGQVSFNSDTLQNGTIDSFVMVKNEANVVTLSFRWFSSYQLKAGTDYFIGYLPAEFRPMVPYVNGSSRFERPINSGTYVIVGNDATGNEGRIALCPSQDCTVAAISATYVAVGGEKV